jgi:hypothetical protein
METKTLEILLRSREKTVSVAWRWLRMFGKCAPAEKTERIARHIQELIPSINAMRAELRSFTRPVLIG